MNPEIQSIEHERRRRRLIRLRGPLPAIGTETDAAPYGYPEVFASAPPPLTVPIGELVERVGQ